MGDTLEIATHKKYQFLGKDLAKSRQKISFNEPRDFDETPRGLRDWAAVVNVWKQNIKN